MLFARSGKIRLGIARSLKTQYLATSQVVVCKILELPFLIPQVLLSAISFYQLRVALAILLPVVGVGLAPLSRTFQANLSINRIGRDLLPMIITLALPLACGLVADRLLRMISRGLKGLLTVTATEIFHQATPSTVEVLSPETPLDLTCPHRMSMEFGPVRTEKDHTIMRSCIVSKVVGSLRLGWRSVVAASLRSA